MSDSPAQSINLPNSLPPMRVYGECSVAVATFMLTVAALFKLGFDGSVTQPKTLSILSGLAGIELLIAIWLAVGIWHSEARLATGLLFGAFIVYQIAAISVGAKSCGCFGEVKTPPLLMAVIDLAVFAGIAGSVRAKFLPGRGKGLVRLNVLILSAAFIPSLALTVSPAFRGCRDLTPIDRQSVLKFDDRAVSGLGMSNTTGNITRARLFVVVDPECDHCRSFLEALAPNLKRWGTSVSTTVVAISGDARAMGIALPRNTRFKSLPKCLVWADSFPFLFIANGGSAPPRMIVAQESPASALPVLFQQFDVAQ